MLSIHHEIEIGVLSVLLLKESINAPTSIDPGLSFRTVQPTEQPQHLKLVYHRPMMPVIARLVPPC